MGTSTRAYAVGTTGTGDYSGLTWDGKNWIGTTTTQGTKNGAGVASLVLGILSVLFCGGGLLCILAIVFGRTGMKRAKVGLATNGGVAKAGFILGLVGLGISLVAGAIYGYLALTGNLEPRTLNTQDVQAAISSGLSEQVSGSFTVTCPSDIKAQTGGTFTCQVLDSSDGSSATVTVTQEDDQGSFNWTVTSASP